MLNINPDNPSNIYFIGIGGISMSGLARILANFGFNVRGSDRDASETTAMLTECGIKVYIGHNGENITNDLDIVVYTAAIREDNPEFVRAAELGINLITRAELLGAIMSWYKNSITVAGTHGKTTTTSMLSLIMMEYTDPTVTVGGILPAIQSNVRIGGRDVFVAEACEYTNSFYSFFPKYSIILNIEEDHPDFFKDISDIRHSFRAFSENVSSDGALFLHCDIDDIPGFSKGLECEVITFGLNESADVHAVDITCEGGSSVFTPVCFGKKLKPMRLNVPGIFNVSNALGAISVSMKLNIPENVIRQGLLKYTGTHRRLEYIGKYNQASIIDDYAHHPTEIRASLKAIREYSFERLIVLFQPHTYSRTEAFFDDFVDALSEADLVLLAEIYAAREENVNNTSSSSIADALIERGKEAMFFSTFDEAEGFLKKNLVNGDVLITMGAGNINTVAYGLGRE